MLHLIVSISAIFEISIGPALRARWERQRREWPKLMEEMRTAAEMARRTAERKAAERCVLYDRIEGWGRIARRSYSRIVRRMVGHSTPKESSWTTSKGFLTRLRLISSGHCRLHEMNGHPQRSQSGPGPTRFRHAGNSQPVAVAGDNKTALNLKSSHRTQVVQFVLNSSVRIGPNRTQRWPSNLIIWNCLLIR
jgi:hypothetical protein